MQTNFSVGAYKAARLNHWRTKTPKECIGAFVKTQAQIELEFEVMESLGGFMFTRDVYELIEDMECLTKAMLEMGYSLEYENKTWVVVRFDKDTGETLGESAIMTTP